MAAAAGTRTSRDIGSLFDSLQKRRVDNLDGTFSEQVRLYNSGGSALTQFGVYALAYGGSTATAPNPRLAAPATSAVYQNYVVAAEAVPATSWGWFVYAGHCTIRVEGTVAVTAADFLKAVNAQTYLVKDATTRSAVSNAVALAAQAAASVANIRCYLIPEQATL